MSLRRSRKASYWNLVMYLLGLSPTHFALTTGENPSKFSSLIPSATTSIAFPSCPTRMGIAAMVDRLPLRHTEIVTENFSRMKVARWPDNFRGTPSTNLCDFFCWLASLISSLMIAAKRAINSILARIGIEYLAARWADLLSFPRFSFESWHGHIIHHIDIDDKYVEIAVRRLAQEVLPLWP